MSEKIILIETATDTCSVALCDKNIIIEQKQANSPKAHATLLADFVQQILTDNNISAKDCAAVAVSEGPGSYTGLRVGVSCAKGLCYGANIPLISVSTLAVITQLAIDKFITSGDKLPSLIVPMIDAGRMEVYTANFNDKGEQLTKTEAKILDENSYAQELEKGLVLFTGNGALKFQPLLNNHPNAIFLEQVPLASGLRNYAYQALQNKKFVDSAYFEPFYLKDFVAGKPKKLL